MDELRIAGVWPRTFSDKDRKRLKNELSHIKNLVIHGTPTDLNIAALNPGIREESQRQYQEMLELGIDLGAQWVTYHPGRASNTVVSPSYVRKHNIEFLKSILSKANNVDVKLAYETFDEKLLEEIPDKTFGLLLDIGHAAMYGNKFNPRRTRRHKNYSGLDRFPWFQTDRNAYS